MTATLDLSGTHTFLGVRLEHWFFGRMALITYALFLGLLGWHAVLTGDATTVVTGLALLLFTLHVLRCFIRDQLSCDRDSLLSFDLVRHLAPRHVITSGDLLEASATADRGRFMLQEMGIEPGPFVQRCRADVEESIDLPSFLQECARQSADRGERAVDANIILFLFFRSMPACREVLHAADLSVDDLQGILQWEAFHQRFHSCASSLDPEGLRMAGGVGRSWVMGYTDALDWLTEEVSAVQPRCGEGSIVIHRDAIDAILHVLSRSHLRNALILGKVGVGKRTLVRNVACTLRELERKRHLPFTRVLVLKTQQLLSGVSNPDGFFLRAFDRAQRSGNFLIVIEDLAVFLTSAPQALRAVLLKFLQARSIAIVGIADTQDYHTLVKTDPSLDSLFEKVTVDDASDEETMRVLMAHMFTVSRRQGFTVTYKAMYAIVGLSKRYLGVRGGFPGKAIEVLDDVILRARQNGISIVREEHVREIISVRSRVNVRAADSQERERLLKLEDTMHQRIIGQGSAVKAVVSALKRARLDLSDRKRPVGTFLFLGPTGVGKTQTAKVLAAEYFGSVDALIRLDMNEYSHENSVFGITGATAADGSQEGYLAQRVQDNPFSLILLDEIEKANPKVLNVFLQILDEGMFTDTRGMKTDFRSSIIIATSNAGALFIRDELKQHPDSRPVEFKAALLEVILREKIFSPEFVNRFDDVVLFMPLSPQDAVQVGQLMLKDVLDDVHRKRGIRVIVEEDLIAALVERGHSIEFGARELRRTITDIIEDYLADYLLRNDVQRGTTMRIRKEDVTW